MSFLSTFLLFCSIAVAEEPPEKSYDDLSNPGLRISMEKKRKLEDNLVMDFAWGTDISMHQKIARP